MDTLFDHTGERRQGRDFLLYFVSALESIESSTDPLFLSNYEPVRTRPWLLTDTSRSICLWVYTIIYIIYHRETLVPHLVNFTPVESPLSLLTFSYFSREFPQVVVTRCHELSCVRLRALGIVLRVTSRLHLYICSAVVCMGT